MGKLPLAWRRCTLGLKGYDFSSAHDINNERINDREIIVNVFEAGADLEPSQA